MKQLLILIIVALFITCCKNEKNNSKSPLKKDNDTVVSYWQTDFNYDRSSQEILIGTDKHQLEINSYSLNDSSVINFKENHKYVYHNYNYEIILKKLNDTILKSEFSKVTFKDSLNQEFYKKCALLGIEYDGIRSNRLYFKGGFFVPETHVGFENAFSIFYQTEKKNQIDSWNYKKIE